MCFLFFAPRCIDFNLLCMEKVLGDQHFPKYTQTTLSSTNNHACVRVTKIKFFSFYFDSREHLTAFQYHVLCCFHVIGSLTDCVPEWPVVPIKVVCNERERVLLLTYLIMRSSTKQAWFLINASHISHVVLVCEAVGCRLWVSGKKPPQKTVAFSRMFMRLTGHSEPLSDNRISRRCLAEWREWRDQKWMNPERGRKWKSFFQAARLIALALWLLFTCTSCSHGVINNEERHWAVFIFSVHSLQPVSVSLFLSPWSFGDYRLFSMLASFPHWSTMAEAPARCPVHTTLRAHRSSELHF